MWDGPKENDAPARKQVLRSGRATSRACSSSAPSTTWTAPLDVSWSCQPVSLSGSQKRAQRSTFASRCSAAYVRSVALTSRCGAHSSRRMATVSTSCSSSGRSSWRAGSSRPSMNDGRVGRHVGTSSGWRASRRAGLRVLMAFTPPRRGLGGVGLGVRAVRAVADDVDAEHPDDGVDRERAVGRRLDERERVDRRRLAAARAVALAVQRTEAGERGEADGQAGEALAAAVGPRPPGGVELGDVRHDGRPPAGARRGVLTACGAGVDEQRRAFLVEHVEQRGEAGRGPSGAASASAPTSSPIAPRASASRSAAGSGSWMPAIAHGRNGSPSSSAPSSHASASSSAWLGGSRSSPSAADGAMQTRSSPSAAASAARASGSWSAGSIAWTRSPGRCSSQPSSRGPLRRARSAARKGSGQRCWWRSAGILLKRFTETIH